MVLEPAPMPPDALTELTPGAACRNCGKPMPEGKSVCPACGAAHGEGNRCPHCNAVADVEPHAALGFRCLVCGGPRIALDDASIALSPATRTALERVGHEQTKHVMFSAAGFLLSGMGALALLVASIVVLSASPGLVPTLATYLAALVPLVAGLLSLSRAAGARRQRAVGLHAARVSALADIQSVTGALDAKRAAQLLRIDAERAELLLAEASVAALLDEAPLPRLRVDAPAAIPTDESPAIEGSAEGRGKTARSNPEI